MKWNVVGQEGETIQKQLMCGKSVKQGGITRQNVELGKNDRRNESLNECTKHKPQNW